MLVGHDPLFGQLAGYLLGTPELQIDFKKGAVLRIDFDSFGPKPRGILRWFLTPKLAAKASKPAVHPRTSGK
jgi:phosphohistidine phosphatase